MLLFPSLDISQCLPFDFGHLILALLQEYHSGSSSLLVILLLSLKKETRRLELQLLLNRPPPCNNGFHPWSVIPHHHIALLLPPVSRCRSLFFSTLSVLRLILAVTNTMFELFSCRETSGQEI